MSVNEAASALQATADALQNMTTQPAAGSASVLKEILASGADREHARQPWGPPRAGEDVVYAARARGSSSGGGPTIFRKVCQQGRIVASKRNVGHMEHGEWQVSHEELIRYRNHERRRPGSFEK